MAEVPLFKVVQMCPDQQLLSVYLDGELPSPWKEKMESHLAQCPACSQRLENYKRLFAPSAENALEEKALMEAAGDRIWEKLEAGRLYSHSNVRPAGKPRAFAGAGILRRRISVSMPAAAAAVVILILAAFWAGGGFVRQPNEIPAKENMLLASDEALPGIIPASDMNGVLQHLGGFDSGDILILRLPESRNFFSSGDPAIIRAADYSRR